MNLQVPRTHANRTTFSPYTPTPIFSPQVTDKPYIAAFLISTDKEALGQLCEKWDQDFVEGGFIPVDQATKSRPTAADVVDW